MGSTYVGVLLYGRGGRVAASLRDQELGLDAEGRFVEGEIISTRQIRPAGPSLDPQQRALNMIRGLSTEDFGNPGLTFHPDGRVTPLDRPPVARRSFPEESP
jgi:hypothetical protein